MWPARRSLGERTTKTIWLKYSPIRRGSGRSKTNKGFTVSRWVFSFFFSSATNNWIWFETRVQLEAQSWRDWSILRVCACLIRNSAKGIRRQMCRDVNLVHLIYTSSSRLSYAWCGLGFHLIAASVMVKNYLQSSYFFNAWLRLRWFNNLCTIPFNDLCFGVFMYVILEIAERISEERKSPYD
jgi:hypothetical protein